MAMSELFAFQGVTKNYQALQIANNDGTPATNIYTSGSVLSAIIYEGQNQAIIATLTAPTWYTAGSTQTGYDQGQFSLAIANTATATLDPAGEYYVQVSQTTSGSTSMVWMGRLKILATPGSVVSNPPDLITLDYCFAAMSELVLSDTQRDFIPYLITAASEAIRRETRGRFFSLNTWIEFQDVALDGSVRLQQPPVQQVLRVQGNPALAITVSNTSAQFAQVLFSYTGQFNGYGSNAQVSTGITLNWTTNGVASTQTILWTSLANQMISTLATAINGAGNGWSASATSTIGLWPVSELDGGFIGQGCASGSSPGSGAQLNVLQDLAPGSWSMDTNRMGFLQVGQQGWGNSDAQRWGPGGFELFGGEGYGYQSQTVQMGRIKATYTAGQAIIPSQIQNVAARLVKWKFELMKQELLLKGETAADYSYTLAEEMVGAMPRDIRQELRSYWIERA